MLSFEDLDKRRIISFFRNLYIAKKKIDEKKLARAKLDYKIERVKNIYTKKRSKLSAGQIEKEFEELRQHIENILEKEKNLTKKHQKDFISKNEFKNRLFELEKKIDLYLNLKTKGHKRVRELDEKIKKTVGGREEEIKLLKLKIKSLEKYYRGLKKAKYSKSDLERIRKRILYLKNELKEVS